MHVIKRPVAVSVWQRLVTPTTTTPHAVDAVIYCRQRFFSLTLHISNSTCRVFNYANAASRTIVLQHGTRAAEGTK